MEKASRVMYSIANFFTWVVVVLSIVGIVLSALVNDKLLKTLFKEINLDYNSSSIGVLQ